MTDRFAAETPAGAPEPLPVLGRLTRLLLAAETVEDVLRRVVLAATGVIPGADLVSITIRHDNGDLRTPVGTGPEAVELDHAQYRNESGPCVDSADPDGPAYALSNDLTGETAWPAFTASATAHGYYAVLSTALLSGAESLPFTGALNIYSRARDGFGDTSRDLAFILATHASLALEIAHTREALADLSHAVTNLEHALEGRTVIGQATGILMARRRLNADQAFAVLKQASQDHNIKLARLAALLTDKADIADRL